MLNQSISSDLFTYPFIADVWGTFSDWAMVIVTGLTLYFIVKTFRSQQHVQNLQLKMTLIENERYRFEIMPKFNVHSEVLVEAEDNGFCQQRV